MESAAPRSIEGATSATYMTGACSQNIRQQQWWQQQYDGFTPVFTPVFFLVFTPGFTPVGNATLVVANVLTCNKHSQKKI
jgi:hypothetical protein